MRKFLLYLLTLFSLIISNKIFANDNYSVFDYQNYKFKNSQNEKILFILDYSNSMNEFLEYERKIILVKDTMKEILPAINPNIEVGLRIYGHRIGLSNYDCCKASKLVAPISFNNSQNIENVLNTTKAKGMTPITYSLKQASNKDFNNYKGKKHIILLSDGGENCDESPCDYVMKNLAKRKDFVIDVIAFNINNQSDLNQLKCVSKVTSGKFYTANTKGELINALKNTTHSKKDVEGVIINN